MPKDVNYIHMLNVALFSGDFSGKDPERERYAMNRYQRLANTWLEKDLPSLSDEELLALNSDETYPYVLCIKSHTTQENTENFILAFVKESWFTFYKESPAAGAPMTPGTYEEVGPIQEARAFVEYQEYLAAVEAQSAKN